MSEHLFKDDDIQQMNAHGISLKETERQLALFKTARPYLKLTAPCTPGKGDIRPGPGFSRIFHGAL